MRLLKYLLLGLTTAFTIGLTGKTSFAFYITPSQPGARIYMPQVPYESDGIIGITWLDTYLSSDPDTSIDIRGGVNEIVLGGTLGFRQLLQQQFPDWTFNYANRDLKGSFEIVSYYACGTDTKCGLERGIPREEIVGSSFWVKYNPVRNDPNGENDPYGDKVHWIQRVRASYNPYINRWNGNFEYIDINPGQGNPYYDSDPERPANTDYFYDRPNTIFANLNNYFTAELYLVEETAPQTATIYNGSRWGWKNAVAKQFEEFFDSLASGREEDNFTVDNLPARAKFYAYIDNDIPGNRCNPNTYLTASGEGSYSDDNSSPVGDGFSSALTGTASSNGTINLRVSAANGGARGEDRGSYKLSILVFDNDVPIENIPPVVAPASGGGGFGQELRGRTQNEPILPSAIEQGGWQIFRNVPSCRWYDPTTSYGFEFQALDDTLFTEILDFPILPDNQFTVSVGDTVVGSFGPGQSLDFVSLLGQGVSNFKITGIDSKGATEETAFPIQLAFNDRVGSFKMRPFTETVLDKTDDGSFGPFSLGFSLPFFGQTYNSFYVNNNGNISFGKPVGAYTSQSLTTQTLAPMIAPYWADVDTRGTGSVSVTKGIPNEVIVTWDKVGYFSQRTDKTASFQMVLRGPDYPIPNGEGNLGFFYKDVGWETTGSSTTPAAIGFGDGLSTVNGGEYLFPGSRQPGISQLVKNHFYWYNLPTTSGATCTSGCTQARTARTASLRLPIFDSDVISEKPKSTPEATSAFGLMALGAWGIIRALLIRKS